ncbi:biotin transport system substrate-specific component [Natranaerovirga hydrolytica]|uniref:Biotin transporter n=1 Tax=Natranaerovirga hydrolytica TaxID=680378 RepID=A0A4R1MLI5_9FIRM|nr:biotin transporter BioY [Natranaerovirga hydrolytica]TCK93477.1 biotin transport system substrate-specific component [Natranaerovirga hydrolytica]
MNLKTRDLILVAMFAALSAVGAFIRIPLPIVPFTLQTFFCAFAGILLGAKLGMLSQVIYVLLGLMGLPIFTQGGGIDYIFNPTFGYLIGFVVGTYVIGLLSEKVKNITVIKLFGIIMTGIMIFYIIGVPYLYFIYRFYLQSDVAIRWAVSIGFIPTIGGDIVKAIILTGVAYKIVPILSKERLIPRKGFIYNEG